MAIGIKLAFVLFMRFFGGFLMVVMVPLLFIATGAQAFMSPPLTVGATWDQLQSSRQNVENFCLPYLNNVSKRYTSEDVQASRNPSFSLDRRSLCLLPLVLDDTKTLLDFFEQSQLVSSESSEPLMLQILESMSQMDFFDDKVEIAEVNLNKLIVNLWLASALIQKSSSVISVAETESLTANLDRLKDLSYLGSVYSGRVFNGFRNYKLGDEDVNEISYSFTADDAIVSHVDLSKISEIACLLNPSANYCPQKIIYYSDFENPISLYILIQNEIRGKSNFLLPKNYSPTNLSDEFLCQQLSSIIASNPSGLELLNCGQTDDDNAGALTSYLEKAAQDGTIGKVAFIFNADRIRKVFPWGKADEGHIYALACYAKDLSYTSIHFRSDENDVKKKLPFFPNAKIEIKNMLSRYQQ